MATSKKSDTGIPQHIAIIADGNRRWAKQHGLEVFLGHEHAVKNTFDPLIDQAIERGVKYLTFWVFSTENWQRHQREVEYLLNLMRQHFGDNIDRLNSRGIKLNTIGRMSDFPQDIQHKIADALDQTKQNETITVTFAMSYGGRDELTRAVKQLATDVAAARLSPEAVSADEIAARLDTADLPDPDLIIRTGGEQRLSGFLLWQCNYAEFMFPDVLFPDFSPEKFDQAIDEYGQRQRRFGK